MRADDDAATVTPLRDPQPVLNEEPPPSPARGLHALAIGGMALCAITGIVLVLALITVNWTDASRRAITTVVVLVGVGFVASAATAVFAAARESHPQRDGRPPAE